MGTIWCGGGWVGEGEGNAEVKALAAATPWCCARCREDWQAEIGVFGREAAGGSDAQPSRAAQPLALLAPAGPEACVLVVGSEETPVAAAMSRTGATVLVLPAWPAGGPHDAGAHTGRAGHTHGGTAALPFADAAFDTIFLGDSLTRLVESAESDHAGRLLLEECSRVLKGGGCLAFFAPNPQSVLAGLRNVRRMPAATGVNVLATVRALGIEAALAGTGFRQLHSFAAWPTRRSAVLRLAAPTRPSLRSLRFDAGSWRHRAAAALAGGMRLLGRPAAMVRDTLVLARQDATRVNTTARPPVVEEIAGGAGIEGILSLEYSAGSDAVHARTPRRFVKVSFDEAGCARLTAEAAALRHLAGTPLGPHTVGAADLRHAAPVAWATYERIPNVGRRTRRSQERRVTEALLLLRRDAAPRRLGATQFWARLNEPQARDALCRLGAAPLLDWLHEHSVNRRVPSGIVHGDLKHDNLLEGPRGLVLVDWDRFETCSPILIDALHASFSFALRDARRGRREPAGPAYRRALQRLYRRDGRLFGVELIDEALGELGWWEAVTLYLLGYTGLLVRLPRTADAATKKEAEYRRRIAVSLRHGPPGPGSAA
jgi:SAM-dependent methyltransferase